MFWVPNKHKIKFKSDHKRWEAHGTIFSIFLPTLFYCCIFRGTCLQANLYAVHYDPKLFPEPDKFKPERFIKDGKIFNTENLMPFGIGTVVLESLGTPCAAATLLAISPDVYNVALCQLLLW